MNVVNVRLSAFWMLGAILSFSLTAIAGKEATSILSPELTVSQLVFFRNIIGLGVILSFCLFISHKKRMSIKTWFNSPSIKLHWGRNIAHFSGQWCWFYGLSLLPLVNVFAIEFTVPIWTAVFAALLLKEQLTPVKLAALVLGFSGVLIILRPGYSVVEFASYVVLFSAVAYGLSHTLTKQLAKKESALSIILFMHLMQFPLAFTMVLFDFSWPQGIVWLYVSVTAIAALLAHFCMAKALSYSDAMVVMPMDFLRLPFIAILGYLFYQEAVDVWLIVGAMVMLIGNTMTLKEAAKSKTASPK